MACSTPCVPLRDPRLWHERVLLGDELSEAREHERSCDPRSIDQEDVLEDIKEGPNGYLIDEVVR